MIRNENDLLVFIKKNLKTESRNVMKSIGDDCAVIKLSKQKYFVITTDTSLLGPHFSKDYKPNEIAYKSLASNLSDIASMGCTPKYILMAITLPFLSDNWIRDFYKGLNLLMKKHNLTLIGGDTNKGPMSISFQVIGVNKHKVLYRDSAKLNDDIYVTGQLGLARAALIFKRKKQQRNYLRYKNNLYRPKPRIDIGIDISKIASSCIDVSDGLSKDLNNILVSSKKGATINFHEIPTSNYILKNLNQTEIYEALLGGGEDYELCFTAHKKHRDIISLISKRHKTKITRIGVITKKELVFYNKEQVIKPKIKGFDHFQS